MAASVSHTAEELTDKTATHSVRGVVMSCVCVWDVVIVSRSNPLLLPRVAPLSQSGVLVHQSVLFTG